MSPQIVTGLLTGCTNSIKAELKVKKKTSSAAKYNRILKCTKQTCPLWPWPHTDKILFREGLTAEASS